MFELLIYVFARKIEFYTTNKTKNGNFKPNKILFYIGKGNLLASKYLSIIV